jgi:hypothetical protein
VLRFLSVVWRTIDAVDKDPSLFNLQAPYLNSVAGTSLDGKGVEATVKILDPFSSFEYDKTYFVDDSSILHYKNAWPAIIADWTEKGLVPKGAVTADDVIWAAPIWHQMKDYQAKADALIKELEGKTLSADNQKLVDQAKHRFEIFDFLDAYRLASAAGA